MFIDFAANHFGAPAERNVVVDGEFESYVSLRWSEEPYKLAESISIRSLRDYALIASSIRSLPLAVLQIVVNVTRITASPMPALGRSTSSMRISFLP